MKRTFRYVFLLLLSINLAACASGARPEVMSVKPDAAYKISQKNKFYQSIGIEFVAGGEKTNPLWTSKVDNASFQTALESSLAAYHLLDQDGDPEYLLNAQLLTLDQPLIGLSFDVTSDVKYQVKKASNDSVVYDQKKTATGTATMGDSVLGTERLRLANEFSIRKNLKEFLDDLTK